MPRRRAPQRVTSCARGSDSVIPTVLSIGTTHPRNVAGVGRDIVVGTDLGFRVFTAIAAISAQDDRGVRALHVLSAAVLRAQLESIDMTDVKAVRVGALGSAENVELVAEHAAASMRPVVVDPVRYASSGEPLIDEAGWSALRARLATFPSVVLTPNLAETASLLERAALRPNEIEAAASALRARGCAAVLVKGGHLDGDPTDVLASSEGVESFEAPRLPLRMRGTGCTLAMALACGLAGGSSVRDALVAARAYLRTKMTASLRE